MKREHAAMLRFFGGIISELADAYLEATEGREEESEEPPAEEVTESDGEEDAEGLTLDERMVQWLEGCDASTAEGATAAILGIPRGCSLLVAEALGWKKQTLWTTVWSWRNGRRQIVASQQTLIAETLAALKERYGVE